MDVCFKCGHSGSIRVKGRWYCSECYDWLIKKEVPFRGRYRRFKIRGSCDEVSTDGKTKTSFYYKPCAIYEKVPVLDKKGRVLSYIRGKPLAYEVDSGGKVKRTKEVRKMSKVVKDHTHKKIVSYQRKVIVSGDIVEIYEYDKPVLTGYENKSKGKGRSCVADDKEKVKNRELVLNRARRDVRRLVNSNCKYYYDEQGRFITPKFMTLTFKDDVRDLKDANYEFTKFIKRLNYNVMGSKKSVLKYLVVPEFQDKTRDGVIHYHLIIFNMPYYDVNSIREDIWFNGYVKINAVYNREKKCLESKLDGQAIDNVGAYVCKYMTLDIDDDRLKENKSYFTSRRLEKSVEIIENKLVNEVVGSLPAEKVVYENTFSNEYNSTHYVQYNMSDIKKERVNKVKFTPI